MDPAMFIFMCPSDASGPLSDLEYRLRNFEMRIEYFRRLDPCWNIYFHVFGLPIRFIVWRHISASMIGSKLSYKTSARRLFEIGLQNNLWPWTQQLIRKRKLSVGGRLETGLPPNRRTPRSSKNFIGFAHQVATSMPGFCTPLCPRRSRRRLDCEPS